MSYTHQDQAAKKVQIAIDKIIDLIQDFDTSIIVAQRAGRIQDELNMLENMIWNMDHKKINRR